MKNERLMNFIERVILNMVRKSKKGIVGKAMPTSSHRYKVGPGIDFVQDNLTNGIEISKAVHNAKADKGLE